MKLMKTLLYKAFSSGYKTVDRFSDQFSRNLRRAFQKQAKVNQVDPIN